MEMWFYGKRAVETRAKDAADHELQNRFTSSKHLILPHVGQIRADQNDASRARLA